MIKLLLVDDHKLVRDGLKSILFLHSYQIEITGEASSGKEAIAFLEQQEVNVVLMDINMPEMNGIVATRYIRENFPHVKVLLLTMLDKEQFVLEAVQIGAHGYVLKTAGYKEIIHAIRTLAEGEEYFSVGVTKMLIRSLKFSSSSRETGSGSMAQAADQVINPEALAVGISPREMEVLQLIAQGYTNRQISEMLFTSIRTIESHRQHLLEKTGTGNTATLIRFAVQQGLIN